MRPCFSSHPTALFPPTRPALVALFVLTISWVGASAQIDRAGLEGTITDATGAVVRGGASTDNFNNNNVNVAFPNTGTGLPPEIQFMLRCEF